MDVKNLLARILPAIEDQTVSGGKGLLPGDAVGDAHQAADQLQLFFRDIGNRGKVLLGNDQDMHRRLGPNILKSQDFGILVDPAGGKVSRHHPAKQAIRNRHRRRSLPSRRQQRVPPGENG